MSNWDENEIEFEVIKTSQRWQRQHDFREVYQEMATRKTKAKENGVLLANEHEISARKIWLSVARRKGGFFNVRIY
jgi:hypothetical protein